jgi:hypothetical protein
MVNPFPKTVSMLTNPAGWKNGTIYSNNVSPLTNKNNPYTNPATPYAGNTNQMTLPKNQTDQSKVAASPTSPNAESIAKVQAEVDARNKLGVPENQTMQDYFANQNKITPQTNADLGSTGTTTGNKTNAQTNVISGLASGGAPTLSDIIGLLYNNYNTDKGAVEKANQELSDFQKGYSQSVANIEGQSPVTLGAQTGQKQVIANQYNSALPAYTQKVANAIAARGQDVSGLQTALGQMTENVAPGNTVVSKTTGQTIAGGLGGYANYNTAEQVFSAANQYKDAVNSNGQTFTYDNNKTPQDNWQDFSTNYLPNSRTYQAGLISSGQTSNIGQGGTTGNNPLTESTVNKTNQAGYTQAYSDYQNMLTKWQSAKTFGDMLIKTLSDGGLNTQDVNYLNQTVNGLKGQISDPALAKFKSTLQATRTAYQDILTAGGGEIPSDATDALKTIIDPTASIGAIQSAIDQLNNEAISARLTPLAEKSNNYLKALQGTGTNENTGTSGTAKEGDTKTTGGYTFTFKNGKWQ